MDVRDEIHDKIRLCTIGSYADEFKLASSRYGRLKVLADKAVVELEEIEGELRRPAVDKREKTRLVSRFEELQKAAGRIKLPRTWQEIVEGVE